MNHALRPQLQPNGPLDLPSLYDANDVRNAWRMKLPANDNLPYDPFVPVATAALAETAIIAMTAAAFLLPMGVAAARFLQDPKKYLDQRFVPCGTEEGASRKTTSPALRGAWKLFPKHDAPEHLTSNDRQKIIEILYPKTRRDLDPNMLGGRPFALPEDPKRVGTGVLPWELRNALWHLPRPDSQPATERTLSHLDAADRVHVAPLFWGAGTTVGGNDAPHARHAARDFLDSRDVGVTPNIVNGPVKPVKSMPPEIQKMLELGYRRRHVARVVNDTREILLKVMAERRPIFIQDMYDLKRFHRSVDGLKLADIFIELPVSEVRTLDKFKTRHSFVRGVTDLLVAHRGILTDSLRESSHDIFSVMTRLSGLLEDEYKDIGDQPVPGLPDMRMQAGGSADMESATVKRIED